MTGTLAGLRGWQARGATPRESCGLAGEHVGVTAFCSLTSPVLGSDSHRHAWEHVCGTHEEQWGHGKQAHNTGRKQRSKQERKEGGKEGKLINKKEKSIKL